MATQVCVLLSLCVAACVTFNLDTTFPLLKTGREGSLFGLSVALHQDLRTDAYQLLVGAPRDKAEPNIPVNQTGGVYSCQISLNQSECSRVKLIDPDVDLSQDLIEDMWLGVSVASQGRPGGRVLACGHRFIKLYGAHKLRSMIGRCYLLGNDLQYNDNDFLNWQKPDEQCNYQGDFRGEAMCTMGISAFITQTEIIVGSPGSFEWQGNVHVSWMNPDDVFETQKSSLPPTKKNRHVYMGYAVVQAPCLLSKDDETIVTGAPRDCKDDARGSVFLVVKQAKKLHINQTLRGEQTGSYFGNAVATTDLNGDGWSDLLVGAPFYFSRQQDVGGAVYVYMNSGGWFLPHPSVVLKGSTRSGFGMAVAAAGDLNQDGFQDFVVGAPFHESGSVMIWTGSSKGVSGEPTQVICGSSISSGFRTFGYSLSAGLDVDGNLYPDLLVGSLDDMVALLRTRPVVHLNKTLRVLPDIIDPNICDFCIQVRVCFSYNFSIGQASDQDNITVHYIVTADVTSLISRLRFYENGQSVYSGYLSMPGKRCETLKAGFMGQIRDKVQPLVFSLNASLYQKLPKKTDVVQDLKHLPVLSQKPQSIQTQIHIQKACGSDNRCHSNLKMTAQFTDDHQRPFPVQNGHQVLHYNATIGEVLLEVNISNTPAPGQLAEDAHVALLNVTFPPSLIYSKVRTKGDVTGLVGCSVEEAVLLCELGNPFKSNHKLQVSITFQSSISLDTREIQSVLKLSTLSEQPDLPPVLVSMLVEYSLQTSLTIINPPGPTFFGGQVIGESAIKKTKDIGSLLLLTLQVHIEGKPMGGLGNLLVEFHWPSEVSNGKWLLYLTEIQVNGTSHSHCNLPNIINPLKLRQSQEGERRRKSLEEVKEETKQTKKVLPVLHLQGQRKKFYSLNCELGANCVKFVCPLTNMNNTATLTVRARLWNSTMIEDYSDARTVLIQGSASLKLQTEKPTVNIVSHAAKIEVYIYPDLGQQADASIPVWIIVVSVLAGVLLLALICLLLWKCGFFVHRTSWQTAVLHQRRILGRDKQQQYMDPDGFLIQEQVSSCRNKKTNPKHWITSWTEEFEML
ncbi:integrin alpha-3-like isoform X3 [Betta splendens]|uniref:Integrin alpha-3-like isoform X3 n=1 Tax=Betta splendens TaxID=158456 RepID=A0A6P7NAW0_BETSP|nr:integrin alpha-3-like isoform X3 [Betta splendens]